MGLKCYSDWHLGAIEIELTTLIRYVSQKIRQNNWWLTSYLVELVWLECLEKGMYLMFRLHIPRC